MSENISANMSADMSDNKNALAKIEGAGLVSLMHSGGAGSLPMPFERDIFLFDTYVAGTTHVEDIHEIEPSLSIGDKLDFFREPDNEHDNMAIVIKCAGGRKIGYVPRADNLIFARLMDAGKLLFGRISDKELRGSWVKLGIKVYLHE